MEEVEGSPDAPMMSVEPSTRVSTTWKAISGCPRKEEKPVIEMHG